MKEQNEQKEKEKKNWKKWFKAAGIRALKTFAQAALSMLTVGQAFIDVNWIKLGKETVIDRLS